VTLGETETGKPVESCLIERTDEKVQDDDGAPRGTVADAMLRELHNMCCQDHHRTVIPAIDGVLPGTYGVKKEAWKQAIFHKAIIATDRANPHAYFNTVCSRMVHKQVIRIAGELVWAVAAV
jgi:hypothetical protein